MPPIKKEELEAEEELKRPPPPLFKRKAAPSLSSTASSRPSKLARRTPEVEETAKHPRSKLSKVTPPATGEVEELRQTLTELREKKKKVDVQLQGEKKLTLHLAQLLKNASRNLGSLSEIITHASNAYSSVRADDDVQAAHDKAWNSFEKGCQSFKQLEGLDVLPKSTTGTSVIRVGSASEELIEFCKKRQSEARLVLPSDSDTAEKQLKRLVTQD
ncbi:hypothetical protein G7Y79_00016g040790 [Physcia stellaris]|nr:hypothetical protein G7Y79_00016g040790 [Physcia stellaris]